jgi:DNA-binding PadR family transcriptional regulator
MKRLAQQQRSNHANPRRDDDRLSEQQKKILDIIAGLEPEGVTEGKYSRYRLSGKTAGYYHPCSIAAALVPAGDRVASASVSRSLTRLVERGLLHRHAYESGWVHYYTLTDAGVEWVNGLRRRRGLPDLVVVDLPEVEPMTDEAFTQRMEALHREWVLIDARQAAARLDRDGLAQLRQWIDERLAEVAAAG